jgi:hypothetical protein
MKGDHELYVDQYAYGDGRGLFQGTIPEQR